MGISTCEHDSNEKEGGEALPCNKRQKGAKHLLDSLMIAYHSHKWDLTMTPARTGDSMQHMQKGKNRHMQLMAKYHQDSID